VRSGGEAALEGARTEIGAIAAEFARAAEPILRGALQRRLGTLLESRAAWRGSLRPADAEAFTSATERAISTGAAEVASRLGDIEVWLSPLTAPGIRGRTEGWDSMIPEWLHSILRRFTRGEEPALGDLDDPSNRIWIALLSAAKPLDPVLREFGLEPSTPGLGGGHYRLQPRTAAQLDPSGTLVSIWRRYRHAYQRYAELRRSQIDRPGSRPAGG
jgi:hypothetical protein